MVEPTENGTVVHGKVISTCHYSSLDGSRGDGVMIGSCQECGTDIVRINPRTGTEEYLDGKSPWARDDNLRKVER